MQPLIRRPQTPDPSRRPGKSRMIAAIRIVLGTGQIMGASVSLMLLLRTGVNGLSLAASAVTGLFVLASSLVVRREKQVVGNRHL